MKKLKCFSQQNFIITHTHKEKFNDANDMKSETDFINALFYVRFRFSSFVLSTKLKILEIRFQL